MALENSDDASASDGELIAIVEVNNPEVELISIKTLKL